MVEENTELAPAENNGQPADSTAKAETTADSTATGDKEQPATASETSFTEKKVDIAEVRKWTPDQLEKAYKEFQADYTRKTQQLSSTQKETESKVATYERDLAAERARNKELQGVAADLMRDPSRLEAYRKVYGRHLGIDETKVADEIPKIETQEDLVKFIERREQLAQEKLLNQIREERTQERTQLGREARWTRAVEQNKADPLFQTDEFQELVVQYLQSPRRDWIARYNRGELNEDQVIKEGIAAVKKVLSPYLEMARKEALKTTEKKKNAVTEMPSKGMATEPARTRTRDEIIERVRQRFGGG